MSGGSITYTLDTNSDDLPCRFCGRPQKREEKYFYRVSVPRGDAMACSRACLDIALRLAEARQPWPPTPARAEAATVTITITELPASSGCRRDCYVCGKRIRSGGLGIGGEGVPRDLAVCSSQCCDGALRLRESGQLQLPANERRVALAIIDNGLALLAQSRRAAGARE